MFPLQRSCELSFQLSGGKDGAHHSDHDPRQQYLFVSDFPHPEFLGSCSESPNTIIGDDSASGPALAGLGRRRRRSSIHGAAAAGDCGDRKRIVHRETERQRRLEMASHYTTLRNLLPEKYVKGRRSMSDHIMEATNYVKDLQRRIIEMESKRQKLKGAEDPLRATNTRSSPGQSHVISVDRSSLGLEIKISCKSDEHAPLSRVLTILMQQGLDVVNCVSTVLKRQLIHVIHAEMEAMSSIDPSWLQRLLLNEICSYDN